jgi:DNA polymerase I-like protein with 3'-5' exonuclease and polymerase domains
MSEGTIRACFVPRPGHVFAVADYNALELHTLAQACVTLLGKSELANALNKGIDPHTVVAANILNITYDEAKAMKDSTHERHGEFTNARQTAKVANFGIPGGLGAAKLVMYARKTYKVILTEREAYKLKDNFLRTWPEMHEYFAYVGNLCDAENPQIEQLFVERVRGGINYCAACNGFFQGLGADCAKEAMWQVARAQYATPASPLYGSRTAAFVHDELLVETKDDPTAHDVATELSRVMVSAASKYLPDVKPKAEAYLMRYWSKSAQPIYDENKRLVPWPSLT